MIENGIHQTGLMDLSVEVLHLILSFLQVNPSAVEKNIREKFLDRLRKGQFIHRLLIPPKEFSKERLDNTASIILLPYLYPSDSIHLPTPVV